LSEVDLLAIHYVVIDDYFSDFKDGENEQRGVKDVSLFQSALYEPQKTFDRKDLYPDILSKAAAYLRSFALNHAFHNGNKRTALMATIVFLEMNGYDVIADPKRLYRLAVTVVISKPPINQITHKYLRKYTRFIGTRNTSSQKHLGFLRYIRDIIIG
jgi:death-on-curing protein